jgi:hypothetical protein
MIVPRFTQDRCVILSDGGVESLLACAMASEQQQLSGNDASILLPGWWEWTEEIDLMISAVDPAIVRQAAVYGLDIFPQQSVYPPDDPHALGESSIGSIQSRILLEAAQIAIRSGIRKVVWPVRIMRPENASVIEGFVDQIAMAIDRGLLASRLASLDATQDTAVDVVIETPFVDLSNDQMLDLAGDLAIPLETCWWYNARTLPNAQERFGYWSRMSLRSPGQIELKPQSQTRV